MEIFKKFFCIFVLFLLIPSVLADGMIYIPHEPPMPEKQQLAAINYENGIEKMILTIGTDEIHAENAAWIFPVPADPEEVVIDVLTKFPVLRGSDVLENAKRSVNRVVENVLMTQILPFLIIRPFMMISAVTEESFGKGAMGYTGDVIVYESIEKEGLTTQIVGAKTGLALYNYFRNKNIYVDPDSISVFDYYSNKDYTFIVTWISSKKEFKEEVEKQGYEFKRQVGVEVMFPTNKIYYPLLPTSVYGSLKIPATIYILDYVKPDLYKDIKSFTKVNYYKGWGLYPDKQLEAFYGNNLVDKYTQISINVPSKYFSDDLWMELGAPGNVKYADFISDKTRSLTWILIPILSMLTGALVGFILFKNWRKFALVGLANCLSLIGLIIAIVFVKDKEVVGKRVIFVIAFSILFIILAYISGVILKLPL